MKISIITVSLNSAATIACTLESILSQSYQDYEVIVKDGLSSDKTVSIVEGYSSLFQGKMKCFSSQDQNLYDAMNFGIKMATGDIIGFLNSDDYYTSSEVLSRINDEFCKTPDLDAVYGDIHYVRASDLLTPIRYYSSKNFRTESMLQGMMPAHPSFYFKRECIDKYGTYDIRYAIASDFDYMLRLIYLKRIDIRYVPMDFVTMRLGGKSNSGILSRIQIIKEHIAIMRNNGLPFNVFHYLCRYPKKLMEFVKR